MTRQAGLHLVSKLRYNSALYFEWDGVYRGKGPLWQTRVDYDAIPVHYLTSERLDQHGLTHTYQLTGVHKKFADKLNIVVIEKLGWSGVCCHLNKVNGIAF